jgi:hypothetical protein
VGSEVLARLEGIAQDATASPSLSRRLHTWTVLRARMVLILVALGGGLAALVVGKGASGQSGRSSPLSWSTPQILASSSQYAFDPQLAVAEDGRTLAAWFGGPPPPPTDKRAGPPVGPPGPAWPGAAVVVDTGTVDGGFSPPVVLSTHGSDGPEGLQVARSGAGVSYVAWEQHNGPWMISSATDGGAFGAPHTLLPRSSQMLALVRSRAGPVAAVWLAYSSSSSTHGVLRYALLRADGSLERVVTVGRWSGSTEGTPFALNDHGEFAAVDIVGQEGEGTVPPRPVVHVCSAGRCSRPYQLRFGHIQAGAVENNAIALSDDGTVTVLAGFSKAPKNPGPNKPLGLWDAVRRPDGGWSSPQRLSAAGEWPLAAAVGLHSALTVFQHFWEPDLRFLGNRLETSMLPPTGVRFTRPAVLRGVEAPDPATLAANLTGDRLLAWMHSKGSEGYESSIFVITSRAGHPGPTQLVVSGEIGGQSPPAGIDRAGDAVVLWNGQNQSGSHGIFASVHRGP